MLYQLFYCALRLLCEKTVDDITETVFKEGEGDGCTSDAVAIDVEGEEGLDEPDNHPAVDFSESIKER